MIRYVDPTMSQSTVHSQKTGMVCFPIPSEQEQTMSELSISH